LVKEQLYGYLITFAVPFLVGYLAKAKWSTWAKFGLTLVFSGTIGALTIYLTTDTWTWNFSVPFMLSIVAASEIYFRAFVDAIPGLKKWLAQNGNKGT